MSRPSTPFGLSPRGSFGNLADAAPGTPTGDEKERVRAELQMQARLQEDVVEKAKKEEVGMPAASPGELSGTSHHAANASSLADLELLRCEYHDDRDQQVCRLGTGFHHDLLT